MNVAINILTIFQKPTNIWRIFEHIDVFWFKALTPYVFSVGNKRRINERRQKEKERSQCLVQILDPLTSHASVQWYTILRPICNDWRQSISHSITLRLGLKINSLMRYLCILWNYNVAILQITLSLKKFRTLSLKNHNTLTMLQSALNWSEAMRICFIILNRRPWVITVPLRPFE